MTYPIIIFASRSGRGSPGNSAEQCVEQLRGYADLGAQDEHPAPHAGRVNRHRRRERRTLRIVAEHGDIWNTFYGDVDEYRHKLDVLARHCGDVGRDPQDVCASR